LSSNLNGLLLSAVVFWPLETAGVGGADVPAHLLRAPIKAIVACSLLAVTALPFALLVRRSIKRHSTSVGFAFDVRP
jgi:hypothetical protein